MMKNIAEDIVLQTNHKTVENEGVAKRVYEIIYKGTPPWEINKVQPAIIELEKDPDFRSAVLDIGCGHGFNSKYLGENGYKVLAIDYLAEVIARAQKINAHPKVKYRNYDIFNKASLIKNYNTILDSATFHGFSDNQRFQYAMIMSKFLKSNSHIYIIGFSDKEERRGGARRLSEDVFTKYFNTGFSIEYIKYSRYFTNIFDGSINAIITKIKKV